jgi:hypothetical protein
MKDEGATHWCAPSQVDGPVYTPAMQCSPAHVVPGAYVRQPPLPSHFPSVPHDPAPWSVQIFRGSLDPAGIGVQVPIAVDSAQVRQLPVQAESQQTPSTQKPLVHSPAAPHDCPFGFRPQLPFWQDWPLTQSASDEQRLRQAPPEQRKGAHPSSPCGRQTPTPSQVPAVFK